MKRLLSARCSPFSFLLRAGLRVKKTDVQSYLEETARLCLERFDDTPAIAEHLAKGLDAYPYSIPLLHHGPTYIVARECYANAVRMRNACWSSSGVPSKDA